MFNWLLSNIASLNGPCCNPQKWMTILYFTNEENEMQIGKVYFQIQPANKW